ncbi:hypothetical protein AMJ40_05595 [candidate division TA06 bacterium DG_26]|uniref:Uncharacterized protein n=1 Tax=candidate division TA06 bacterium DG_26 TaxID=1703771 RepID=A0A0S7WGZ5_UNCT6|nr:MAG: hypothetical protein AMJ40_05595 [candidate division TA06 bacterium DG_26]
MNPLCCLPAEASVTVPAPSRRSRTQIVSLPVYPRSGMRRVPAISALHSVPVLQGMVFFSNVSVNGRY